MTAADLALVGLTELDLDDLFAEDEQRLAAIRTWLERLGLAAILADCTLQRSRTSKEQAAVSGIIHELTHAWAPSFR